MAKFTSIDKQSSTDASKEKKKNHSLHVINHILVSYLPALRRVKDNAVRFRQPKKINFASEYARKLRERRNRGAAKETRASESSGKSSGMTKRQPLLSGRDVADRAPLCHPPCSSADLDFSLRRSGGLIGGTLTVRCTTDSESVDICVSMCREHQRQKEDR